MNERIKLLKHQASVWCDENIPEQFSEETNGYGSAWEDKFAELIVRECLKEIKDMIVDESELLYPNNKQTTEYVNERLLDAHDNISEHFGVEE